MSEMDREFWITIRAALIMFVRAIEKRYELKGNTFVNPVGYNVEVKG